MARVRARTWSVAVLVCAAAAGGCSADLPVAERPTIATLGPATTAASLALPQDLCAALDPALLTAVVPDLDEIRSQPRRTDTMQDDTGCYTTGGAASLSVALTHYRFAITSAEEAADGWLRAGCTYHRARVVADGLGSRSCAATSVEHGEQPEFGAVVNARTGSVVVAVQVRDAPAEVDTSGLAALAQQALDAVPDLPEADEEQPVPETGEPAAQLPAQLCSAMPQNLRDYLVPALTTSTATATASGPTVAATCRLDNGEATPEPTLPAELSAEIIGFGPELGYTAQQAAEHAFDEACQVLGDPTTADLGDEQCSQIREDDDRSTIHRLVVRVGVVVVDVTYQHSRLDTRVVPPSDDAAHLVAEALLQQV